MINKLIVGIGNEGVEYLNTRHNIGHFVVDTIGEKSDAIFVKTPGCINNCGEFVKALASTYKLSPDQILIIHDNLNLQLGQTSLSYSKNTFGHNGLKSVKTALNNESFHKLSIGIGRPQPDTSILDYVLGQMSYQEGEVIINTLPQIENLIKQWLELPYKPLNSPIC